MSNYTYEDEVEYALAKEETEWKKKNPNSYRISDGKMYKAIAILEKSEQQAPFHRALRILDLYEKAKKGIELQKQLDVVNQSLKEVMAQRNILMEDFSKLKVQLDLVEGKTFWARLLGLFSAKAS